MKRGNRSTCFTHSFEGFLKGLVSCVSDCIAGERFWFWRFWWFTWWEFLIFRLCWWWNLLLILFLSHFLKAVTLSFWHLQGCWGKQGSSGYTPSVQTWASFQTSLGFCSNFLYPPCVLKVTLISETAGMPSLVAPNSEIQFFYPPSFAYVRSCYWPRLYSCNISQLHNYNSQRNSVKYQQHFK